MADTFPVGPSTRHALPYATTLKRQQAAVREGYLAASARLRWSDDRLAAERQRRLRDLLAWSQQHSPFHRDRLRDVDVSTFTEDRLPTLPVMTKADAAENFERVVTDPRLTWEAVSSHADPSGRDSYLFDQYRTIESGGTSGVRGVYVYGWTDWVEFYLQTTRWSARSAPDSTGPPAALATLFASNAGHVSGALHAFARGLTDDGPTVTHLPASLPLPRLVDGLNRAQPTVLQGYPTVVHLLALEAVAGRLSVHPRHVGTCGEQCTEETRTAVRDAWDVEIEDVWGCSEGIYAFPCAAGRALHLPDDLAILEPVDNEGNVVPAGVPADRVLFTNLYNHTQPLIRYEIPDGMTLVSEPCACGCRHRRIDRLSGRSDTLFRYGEGVVLHGMAMTTALLVDKGVTEFQVSQTPSGADVRLVAGRSCDFGRIQKEFITLMREAGLPRPEVRVTPIDNIERLWSGKLKQFEPLVPT